MKNFNKVFSGEGKMHVGENEVGFLVQNENLWMFKVVKKLDVEAYLDMANEFSNDRDNIVRGLAYYLEKKDFDELASCSFANMLPYVFFQLVPIEKLRTGGIFIGRIDRKNGIISQ